MTENLSSQPLKLGDQKTQKLPPRHDGPKFQRTKPVDIQETNPNTALGRKFASEMFTQNTNKHPGYSQSLPVQSTFKVRTPGAPLFKSRPPPIEDSIPPLSLPPASYFSTFNQRETLADDMKEFQYASSCPASIWHFEDSRRSSSTGSKALHMVPQEEGNDISDEAYYRQGPRKNSITALMILEGSTSSEAQLAEGLAQLRAEEGSLSSRSSGSGRDKMENFPGGGEEGPRSLPKSLRELEDFRNRFPSIEDPFVLDPVEADAINSIPEFTLS
mmetsp:Transcript_38301/g.50477  ORF Transcript_38301/g.50477 Transcript_38301/m.50477 type:complete len:273 (-) Transcript_38301:360-1178(-)|eukprot:CAMPEP_0117752976 /NCGR_PEP_ID=MMETSP0947-20121206/11947_1 /TAXON_ID=44440 /ORGANISM="Chattonella subsalsa, Strain CCMP2191" /LENGTH=272 /DNA_ID=CAMNT_0005571763 /DNA_START=55 /DNA_END=873 /DNA_ORIENTATION=+